MKNKDLILDYNPIYLNINRIFSHQDLNFFILIGGRGIGKTTGVSYKFAQNFLKRDEQFVYVRRYKTEVSKSKDLFSKVLRGVKTKGIGGGAYTYNYKNNVMGWAIPLTTAPTFKSGIDFSRVSLICFDEAILKRGSSYRYLADEIHAFFELVSTIVRTRTNYKVLVLGNNMDIFNPYFDYFKVPKFDNIYIDKSRGLYCELSKINPELLNLEEKTPLYKLTKDTEYGDYHYSNKPLLSDCYKKDIKLATDTFLCRIVYNNYTLNIYRHIHYSLFIELKEKIIKDNTTFTLMESNKPNYYYIDILRKSSIYKLITYAFFNDYVYYENDKCGEIFSNIMEEI